VGDQDAFWLIRTMRERFPSHAILGCGANADPTTISRVLFMGADGFVDKNIDPVEFLQSLRRAADREMVLAGPASISVGQIAEGIERRRDLDVRLTLREREVLSVAAEGLTAREIAARLGVRERTVTTHLARIYGKLGVGSRLAAIRLAARAGLVSVGTHE
jgi:DNA-binding NarL/FixJ family response regulator